MRLAPNKPRKPPTVPNVQADEVYAGNEATRKRIAQRQTEAWVQAVCVCGPNATGYGKWRVKDRTGREPDRLVFCCQRPTHAGWKPAPEDMLPDADERLTAADHPGYWVTPPGQPARHGFPFRYMVCFEFIEQYDPMSAEEMKAAAEKRRAKALAKLAAHQAAEAKRITPSMFSDTAGVPQ